MFSEFWSIFTHFNPFKKALERQQPQNKLLVPPVAVSKPIWWLIFKLQSLIMSSLATTVTSSFHSGGGRKRHARYRLFWEVTLLTTVLVGGCAEMAGNRSCIQTAWCRSSSSPRWPCTAYSRRARAPAGKRQRVSYLPLATQWVRGAACRRNPPVCLPDTAAYRQKRCTGCPGPGL